MNMSMASFPPVGYEAMIALMAFVTCLFVSRELGSFGLAVSVSEVGETGDAGAVSSKPFLVAVVQPERAMSRSCVIKQQRLPQRKQVFPVQ